jgi:predicted nuclease of predicted toxin-antitoxin system
MKILLDESLPVKLSEYLNEKHIVFTVKDMNWLGKKNGELLKLIIENEFEVFVTADRNLPYQQNLKDIPVTIAILCGVNNRQQTYINLVPKLLEILVQRELPKVIEII